MIEKLNYKHNKQITLANDYLNGQGKGELAKMKYGICSMSWNGCEMIAIYNAMHHIGRHEELAEIAKEMYPVSQVAMGFFGSNVYALWLYFKRHNVKYRACFSYNDFFNQLPEHSCGVVSFWNRRILFGSLHTVMVRKEGNQFVVYNKTNGSTQAVAVPFRGMIAKKKLFIIGYLIDE